jgi:hypothetical protein
VVHVAAIAATQALHRCRQHRFNVVESTPSFVTRPMNDAKALAARSVAGAPALAQHEREGLGQAFRDMRLLSVFRHWRHTAKEHSTSLV